MNKVFSIIIPVYNEEQGLKKSIKYFINDKYTNYEIILIDDGSTDKSGIICDELEKEYNCIKVIHQPNSGCVIARKSGIKIAEGKYIVFADADDMVKEDYFDNLYKAIKQDADLYLLNNCTNIIGTDDFITEKNFLKTGFSKVNHIAEWILTGKAGAVWDKIYLADILKKIALDRKIVFGEDVFININYIKYVKKIYIQDTDSYCHYIDSPTSVCNHNVPIKRIDEIKLIYEEGIRLIEEIKLSNETKNKFKMVCISNLAKTIGIMKLNNFKSVNIKTQMKLNSIYEICQDIKINSFHEFLYLVCVKYNLYLLAKIMVRIRSNLAEKKSKK